MKTKSVPAHIPPNWRQPARGRLRYWDREAWQAHADEPPDDWDGGSFWSDVPDAATAPSHTPQWDARTRATRTN